MFQPKLTLHFTLYLSIYKAFDTTEGKPKGCVGFKHEPTGLKLSINQTTQSYNSLLQYDKLRRNIIATICIVHF